MSNKVAVIGAGTQGSMIAFRNALYGKEVSAYSRNESSREKCRARIERFAEFYVENGKLTAEEAETLKARVSYATSLEEACDGAYMVIENIRRCLGSWRRSALRMCFLARIHLLFS